MTRRSFLLHAVVFLVCAAGAATAQVSLPSLGELLSHLGGRVEQYYSHARSIVCVETVRLQPLNASLASDGHARELVYDLRVTWDVDDNGQAKDEPTVLRELRTVDGRKPKPNFEPGCMDPPAVATEPLSFLLPDRQEKYLFTLAGGGRERKRQALMIDYRSRKVEPAEVKWRDDCVSISLPGRTRGRVWVDADSHDVLRVDERLIGRFDLEVPPEKARFGDRWMEIERVDTTTRYRSVTFDEPSETVMLPESVTTLTIISGAGVPRLRTTQNYSGYRRFVTDARMVLPD